mgnify:CR=1 FL=1
MIKQCGNCEFWDREDDMNSPVFINRKIAEWKEYTGSNEQIKEINRAINESSSGVLLMLRNGTQKMIASQIYAYDFTAYLICVSNLRPCPTYPAVV